MKKGQLFGLLFWLFGGLVFGQNVENDAAFLRSKRLVFLEAGGSAGYGSLNFERLFLDKKWMKKAAEKRLAFSARVGLSGYRIRNFRSDFGPDLIVPFSIHAVFGKKHGAEIAVGQTVSSNVAADPKTFLPDRSTFFSATFSIGYRFQKARRGPVFKLFYAPFLERNRRLRQWAGVSVGFGF